MLKRLLSVFISVLLLFALIPLSHAELGTDIVGTGGLVLDMDPEGGYEGDYVVIYNPGTSTYSSLSTGNMQGLIETEIDPYRSSDLDISGTEDPYRIDVDGLIAEIDAERTPIEPPPAERTSYNVGDIKTFTISNYSPGPSSLSFKCLAKGDHCYVWTPSQNVTNYYPLDSIDPTYAELVADEFDLKYPDMNSSFGDHNNGSGGDGRVHLMYYNIDDGFQPGVSEGYVAGYFSSYDFFSNGLPMIHIDTYPGVYYVNTEGEAILRLSRTYGVFCHEYQHLINYSQTGGMDTWLNECMSAAAEEICYPGSSVVSRIQSWERYYYSDNDDWLEPPHEFEYYPAYELHNGYSMYDWSNGLNYVLPLYSQVSFFSQYLFTHYGNTIFKTITQRYSQSNDSVSAIASATGTNTSELVKNFRIAVTANDYAAYDHEYGFLPQEDYDPEEYNGVENPYNLLGPVVFTGNSCSIKGGGAITVKPVGGVYVPPSGAASGLEYIGVTRSFSSEPVALEGISITPEYATAYVGYTTTVRISKTPINANDYSVEWTVSNPNIISVSGTNYAATVTGLSVGTASVICTATDNITGAVYHADAAITVQAYPTVSDALNVSNGTLEFTTSNQYPWELNFDFNNRLCMNSTNNGVSSSTSYIQTTVEMEAGETLSFEWSVSSETNYDKLIFYVNGSQTANISGSVAFTSYTYTASSSGSYTFKWSYEKDYSVNSGNDMGYLDNVSYSGDPGGTTEPLMGDADLNGTVDISDALLVLRCAMGLISMTDEQILASDMDGNGIIQINDALTVLRIAMGLIS